MSTPGHAGSFGAADTLTVDGASYGIHRVDAVEGSARLPFCLKVLLENLLRNEDGHLVTAAQVEALAEWDPAAEPSAEIQFTPARVLMQDFTGVPYLVDLAAMREAMAALGGDPARVNPLRPAELIIDHSVIADYFGRPDALARNIELEYRRNAERYAFLRWGQQALAGLWVVPPGTGICHQANLEHLARVVFAEDGAAFCDTLVGTDSHTPMVNGLGVLGWGVGGIEAKAAMLGQPLSMLIPKVIGVRLTGELPEGATATDLVLTIAELLRSVGVVGTMVEFSGPGVARVPVANRATIGNMSPEYGNSGPLIPAVSAAIAEGDLAVCSVLSGNRNFEGRIHPETKLNYLASPPLVVAYALAGSMDVNLTTDPLGTGTDGKPVYLRDIWPSAAEIGEVIAACLRPEMFTREYAQVFAGDDRWRSLPVPPGDAFAWDPASTYVRRPPFFDDLSPEPAPLAGIEGARVLVLLGDSVTTDHISPAGAIRADSPAGQYLPAHGVEPREFNSYGSRRGNHEVMIRGTFANIRLRNRLASGTEGGFTRHLPGGEQLTIYDAAQRYAAEGVPLLVIAGKEYGSGSSRDWAAKGTALLGVRAVLAVSFERIHRSNLIGMGVLPLQFPSGQDAASLGLTGEETYAVRGLAEAAEVPHMVTVTAAGPAGTRKFPATVRIDTPAEAAYYRHGGILPYVLRRLAAPGAGAPR